MSRVVFLFPDTNLFAQCKPLSELDWSLWNTDEVELIVCRPIQAEIDGHKGKGTGRLAKRARKTSSLFREALTNGSGFVEIRSNGPVVRLYVRSELKVDPTLAEVLSYEERDHQLVGTAAKFATAHPDYDVRVLTHDTGPMGAARAANVPFTAIPEAWLLPPELDEAEKRARTLETELATYRRAEPAFEARRSGDVSNASIVTNVPFYMPLTAGEIDSLMAQLRAQVPQAIDFGSKEPQQRGIQGLAAFLHFQETFVPADEEAIRQYHEERYPTWLRTCESYLRNLHETLNAQIPWPLETFSIRNIGSRPAEDALITFTCEGAFQLMAPPKEDEDSGTAAPALPSSPTPPKGQWVKKRYPGFDIQSIVGRSLPSFHDVLPLRATTGRDPNGFYWKPSRPNQPCSSVSLTCQQWRHLVEAESFDFVLSWAVSPQPIQGALRLDVHAANLTQTFTQLFPVRLAFETATSALPVAERLIERVAGSE